MKKTSIWVGVTVFMMCLFTRQLFCNGVDQGQEIGDSKKDVFIHIHENEQIRALNRLAALERFDEEYYNMWKQRMAMVLISGGIGITSLVSGNPWAAQLSNIFGFGCIMSLIVKSTQRDDIAESYEHDAV